MLFTKLLDEVGIAIGSRVYQIHDVVDTKEVNSATMSQLNDLADKSSVRCLNNDAEEKMINDIDQAKSSGDSVGGSFEVIAKGMPYGLGSYQR